MASEGAAAGRHHDHRAHAKRQDDHHRDHFADPKDCLAGFHMIEACDLNEAIQIASRIPPAQIGSIEVRPVRPIREVPNAITWKSLRSRQPARVTEVAALSRKNGQEFLKTSFARH